MLLALHRHRSRQAFVEEVVRDRLEIAPDHEARVVDALLARPVTASGVVPGLEQWHYGLGGLRCQLTHVDGTTLVVEFDEHGSISIAPEHYQRWLVTAAARGIVERRLGRSRAWMASLDPLREAGLLRGTAESIRVVQGAFDFCNDASEALEDADGDTRRLARVAEQLEDAPLACELLGSTAGKRLVSQARDAVTRRSAELEERAARRLGDHPDACFVALAELAPERARSLALLDLEHGVLDRTLAACMRHLSTAPRRDDVPTVCALAGRLHAADSRDFALRLDVARHLLSLHRRETLNENVRELVLQVLEPDHEQLEGEAALLLHLLDPDAGLSRMLRGLSGRAQHDCAAALTLVGAADRVPDELEPDPSDLDDYVELVQRWNAH